MKVSLEQVREVLESVYCMTSPLPNIIMALLEEPEKQTAKEAIMAGKVIKAHINSTIYKLIDGVVCWRSMEDKWEKSLCMIPSSRLQNSTDWEEVPDPSVPTKTTAIEALRAGKVIKGWSDLTYKMIDGKVYFWSKKAWFEYNEWQMLPQNFTDWELADDPSISKFKRDGGKLVDNERVKQIKVWNSSFIEQLFSRDPDAGFITAGETIILPHGDRRRAE